MFNIGLPEFLLFAIVAIVFIGPERLPAVARWLGKQAAKVRKAWREIQADMEEDEDFRQIKIASRKLKQELSSVSRELKRAGEDAKLDDSKESGKEVDDTSTFDDDVEMLRQSRAAGETPIQRYHSTNVATTTETTEESEEQS